MKTGGLTSVCQPPGGSFPASTDGSRSLAYRTPITLSMVDAYTGERECSDERTMSTTSRQFDELSMPTRSMRGTMISCTSCLAKPEHAVEQHLRVRRNLGFGGDDLLELLGHGFAIFLVLERSRQERVQSAIESFAQNDDGREGALNGDHQP